MELAKLGVEPLANHASITDDDGTNEGIGANPATPPVCKLQSPREVRPIRACELGFHPTD
jgi:hypothetical protein